MRIVKRVSVEPFKGPVDGLYAPIQVSRHGCRQSCRVHQVHGELCRFFNGQLVIQERVEDEEGVPCLDRLLVVVEDIQRTREILREGVDCMHEVTGVPSLTACPFISTTFLMIYKVLKELTSKTNLIPLPLNHTFIPLQIQKINRGRVPPKRDIIIRD